MTPAVKEGARAVGFMAALSVVLIPCVAALSLATAEQVARGKPAPDLFLSALEAMLSVDAAAIAKSCENKAQIPERLHAARVAAVAARLDRPA